MAEPFTEINEDSAFPYTLRNVVVLRDQIIEFYRWIIEEDALENRLHIRDFDSERMKRAIVNWQECAPDAFARLDVHFKNSDDAVFFRMKFT